MKARTIMIAAVIAALIIALTVGILSAGLAGVGSAKVAIIPISGVILTESDESLFAATSTSSTQTVRWLEDADEDPSIKAILLEINSPGGSAVASDEIARAVSNIDKPVIAWIRESGASGAYWIASEADHVVANRMSITGSVGVIASYLEFHGFLEDHNVTYRQVTGGEHKDIGNPFAELDQKEQALLDKKVSMIHEFFLDDVQENRNLTDEQRAEVETGIFFIGAEAIELGLVDELGGRDEVEAWLEKELGSEPSYKRFQKPKGLLEGMLGANAAFSPLMTDRISIRS